MDIRVSGWRLLHLIVFINLKTELKTHLILFSNGVCIFQFDRAISRFYSVGMSTVLLYRNLLAYRRVGKPEIKQDDIIQFKTGAHKPM